jgi:hypothetical protein
MKRQVRPMPERTKPHRSVLNHLGGTALANIKGNMVGDAYPRGSGFGQSTDKVDDSKVGDIVKHAAELMYRVIDRQIAQGREAAQSIRGGRYTSLRNETDVMHLLQRAVMLTKSLSITGFDVVSAVVKGVRLRPAESGVYTQTTDAACSNTVSRSGASAIAIDSRSKKPLQINYKWNPRAPHFMPAVRKLESADRSSPPIKGVYFTVTSDGRPILIVDVPEDQPPGTYTGPILDEFSKERGSVSITILG